MRFASPLFLVLIPFVGLLWWFFRHKQQQTSLQYGSLSPLDGLEDRWGTRLLCIKKHLRYVLLIIIVIALARPQGVSVERDILTEGVDIMISMDTSGSMQAEDFSPFNRLAESKRVIKGFIEKRRHDRIGLVVFGNDAFTQCPLTLDYDMLAHLVDRIEVGIAGDGTAVGMGIATGLNRLKASKSRSKVMILMTDGENNSGEIDPLSAADLAHDLGVKIYTVGIGKVGGAPVPIQDPILGKVYARNPDGSLFLPQLDETTLKTIAQKTSGRYFRATDTTTFKQIYDQIDALEKTDIKTKQYPQYTDYFMPLLWIVFGLLCVEIGLGWWLRSGL